MNYIIFTFFLLSALFSARKEKPHLFRLFSYRTGYFCHRNIVLSSDSLYFLSDPCENDIALSKGRWKIMDDKLILCEFDSSECFPQATVAYGKFRSPDSARITFTDYFGKPFTGTSILLFDSTGKETYEEVEYHDLSNNGSVIFPLKKFVAFVPIYLVNYDKLTNRPDKYQQIAGGKNDINIKLNCPEGIALAEATFVHHFGQDQKYAWGDSVLFNSDGTVKCRNEIEK